MTLQESPDAIDIINAKSFAKLLDNIAGIAALPRALNARGRCEVLGEHVRPFPRRHRARIFEIRQEQTCDLGEVSLMSHAILCRYGDVKLLAGTFHSHSRITVIDSSNAPFER